MQNSDPHMVTVRQPNLSHSGPDITPRHVIMDSASDPTYAENETNVKSLQSEKSSTKT